MFYHLKDSRRFPCCTSKRSLFPGTLPVKVLNSWIKTKTRKKDMEAKLREKVKLCSQTMIKRSVARLLETFRGMLVCSAACDVSAVMLMFPNKGVTDSVVYCKIPGGTYTHTSFLFYQINMLTHSSCGSEQRWYT